MGKGRTLFRGYYALRWQILERDNFTCQYCGQKVPDVKMEVDHVIPVCEGGTDEPENLKACCFACNRGKSALSLMVRRRVTKRSTVAPVPALKNLDGTTHKMLEGLREHPKGITARELAVDVGTTLNTCRVTLNLFKKRGLADNIEKGIWKLTK